MQKTQLTFVLLLVGTLAFAQDAKMILKKSYSKCQSIQNGYYEMTTYYKSFSYEDTSRSSYFCHFKKLKDDSIFSSAFNYYSFLDDSSKFTLLYTGDELITSMSKERSATIISKFTWEEDIWQYARNSKFYSPLTERKSLPLLQDSDFINKQSSFKFIAEEFVNGALCYHIQVSRTPIAREDHMTKPIRHENHFWIKKEDYVPVQYVTAMDLVMNEDTMHLYQKDVLNKYELNNLKDDSILTLKAIPSFYTIKDYVPFKAPTLLKKDSIAPNWELLSLQDEKISLKSLLGKVVLVDFFYKACYPCMQALPGLQALHEKYKEKGLRVIGINPNDKKESDIAAFLAKRGVTYPVLLGGREVANDYRVSGYPTMYLIDKTGKIIFVQLGYGKEVDAVLEDLVKNNL